MENFDNYWRVSCLLLRNGSDAIGSIKLISECAL